MFVSSSPGYNRTYVRYSLWYRSAKIEGLTQKQRDVLEVLRQHMQARVSSDGSWDWRCAWHELQLNCSFAFGGFGAREIIERDPTKPRALKMHLGESNGDSDPSVSNATRKLVIVLRFCNRWIELLRKWITTYWPRCSWCAYLAEAAIEQYVPVPKGICRTIAGLVCIADSRWESMINAGFTMVTG